MQRHGVARVGFVNEVLRRCVVGGHPAAVVVAGGAADLQVAGAVGPQAEFKGRSAAAGVVLGLPPDAVGAAGVDFIDQHRPLVQQVAVSEIGHPPHRVAVRAGIGDLAVIDHADLIGQGIPRTLARRCGGLFDAGDAADLPHAFVFQPDAVAHDGFIGPFHAVLDIADFGADLNAGRAGGGDVAAVPDVAGFRAVGALDADLERRGLRRAFALEQLVHRGLLGIHRDIGRHGRGSVGVFHLQVVLEHAAGLPAGHDLGADEKPVVVVVGVGGPRQGGAAPGAVGAVAVNQRAAGHVAVRMVVADVDFDRVALARLHGMTHVLVFVRLAVCGTVPCRAQRVGVAFRGRQHHRGIGDGIATRIMGGHPQSPRTGRISRPVPVPRCARHAGPRLHVGAVQGRQRRAPAGRRRVRQAEVEVEGRACVAQRHGACPGALNPRVPVVFARDRHGILLLGAGGFGGDFEVVHVHLAVGLIGGFRYG